MNRPVLTERMTLAGIPVLHVAPRETQGPTPTVFFYHGWGSSKEAQLITASALACEGFRVLAPDAPRHGEREPFADYDSLEALIQFWEIVMRSITEAEALADAAIQTGLADPARMATGGSSMGGMIASGALARYPWARTVVLFNGCPCYEWWAANYREIKNYPPLSEEERLSFRQYDPEALVERVAPRPVLMMHGTADTMVSVAGVRRFTELAAPLYAEHPERLKLTEYPRLDHYVTAGMIEEGREWFKRYLLED